MAESPLYGMCVSRISSSYAQFFDSFFVRLYYIDLRLSFLLFRFLHESVSPRFDLSKERLELELFFFSSTFLFIFNHSINNAVINLLIRCDDNVYICLGFGNIFVLMHWRCCFLYLGVDNLVVSVTCWRWWFYLVGNQDYDIFICLGDSSNSSNSSNVLTIMFLFVWALVIFLW